ncbi:hypothetical protein BACCIP111895_04481 [Neobacillus rhizosphaerae]|uniref:Uncharacterized protein n=1 Tax=Neobacillus rhizosphaerae TaxID=2880965 RepID=A0ABM9EX96_9BACI|nr:hypothetical protein BACCIP111895_04481 [Neobacillus rhizosphaerae]
MMENRRFIYPDPNLINLLVEFKLELLVHSYVIPIGNITRISKAVSSLRPENRCSKGISNILLIDIFIWCYLAADMLNYYYYNLIIVLINMTTY